MTKYLAVPIIGLGAGLGKMSLDFGQSFAKVSTLLDENVVDFDEYKKSLIKGSSDSKVAVGEYSEAVYGSISAGVDQTKAVEFTTKAMALARGGFTTGAKAVDVMTTAINGYGLETEDATKISDLLITTQNLGKTTTDELASSMGKVIPIASGANFGMEELSASYALLTKNGVATAESGTYLKSMLNELTKSGSKTDKALKKLSGKGFAELKKEGKSTTEILGMLDKEAQANGMTLKDMFGSVEAGTAAMMIGADGGVEYDEMLKAMEESAGATQEAVEKIDNSPLEKLKDSFNKLKNAGLSVGELLMPMVTEFADKLTSFADKIANLDEKQLKNIVTIAKVVLAIIGVIVVVGKLLKAFLALREINNVLKGISVLGKALSLGTIGIALAIIAIIVALVILIVKNWDTIKEKTIEIWNAIKDFVVNVWTAIWEKIKVIGTAIWDFIIMCFNGIKDFVVICFTAVKDFIVAVFTAIWSFITMVWDGITTVIKIAILAIKLIVETIFTLLITIIRVPMEIILAVITTIWNFIGETVMSIVTAIKDFIDMVFTAIKDFIVMIFTTVKDFIVEVWTAIYNFIAEIATSVWNKITEIWNAIYTVISEIFNKVWNYISGIWNTIYGFISGIATSIWNKITEIWTSIYNITMEKWNAVKESIQNTWNGIKESVSNAINSVKDTVSNIWDSIKAVTQQKWNAVKEAIMTPINLAKEGVSNAIDAIKGFFDNLLLKFPQIQLPKMPHFKLDGEFSLKNMTVPKLGVDWYSNGGIFTKRTILPSGIGVGDANNGSGNAMEAVLPISQLSSIMSNMMQDLGYGNNQKEDQGININIENFNNETGQSIEELSTELEFYRKQKNLGKGVTA